MRRVVMFVGNYGPYLPNFPLVGHLGPEVVVFVDRRHSPGERQRALDAVVPLAEVESVEVAVTAPSTPDDCPDGIHWWEPIERGGQTIGAACRYCSLIEHVRPISAPITRVPVEAARV